MAKKTTSQASGRTSLGAGKLLPSPASEQGSKQPGTQVAPWSNPRRDRTEVIGAKCLL
jgi:hypothetical protein